MIMEIKCPNCNLLLMTLKKDVIEQADIDNCLSMVACDCGNVSNEASIVQDFIGENMSDNAEEFLNDFTEQNKFNFKSILKSPIFWLFVIALFFTFKSFAESFDQRVVSVTGTSTKFLNPNSQRKYLRIENRNSHDIYLKYGSAHVATEGVLIVKSTSYVVDSAVPVESIFMKSAGASVDVGIIEVTK